MTLADSSSPPPSSSRLASRTGWDEVLQCSFDDDDCRARVQDQRHQDEQQAKLEQMRRDQEVQHEEQLEQMRANAKAAGLDPDKGKGWFCFEGTIGDQALGECRRTFDECADQLLMRERAGLVAKERRCVRFAQAACFDVTRDLEEGSRAMCFTAVDTCERLRAGTDPEGFVAPPSECGVTD